MSTLAFPPGAVLCLYTDGLVERRDRPLDDGIARLSAALTAALTATDPEAACACVMAGMTDYGPHDDDIALAHPPPGTGLARRQWSGSACHPGSRERG